MRQCIIFNPTARGGKARSFRRELDDLRGESACYPTAGPGSARELAAAAVRGGYDTILAAGGDGTLNEVLNGIGDVPEGLERTCLAVLPLGTINVFAREIGLPREWRFAWKGLHAGREVRVDIGEAEFVEGTRPARRLFVQLGGIGLDAHAVSSVNWSLKKKIGYLAYVWSGLLAFMARQPRLAISSDEGEEAGELVLIGNGRFYGGSVPIFDRANLQDGRMDVCIFRRITWLTVLRYGWAAATRRIIGRGGEHHFQTREVRVRAEGGPAYLQLDGEFAGMAPARLRILPRALRLLVPAGGKLFL